MRISRAGRATAIIFAISVTFAGSCDAEPYFRGDLRHRPRLSFDGRDAAHIARVVDRVRRNEQPWAAAWASQVTLASGGKPVDHRSSGWNSQPDPYAVLYGADPVLGPALEKARAIRDGVESEMGGKTGMKTRRNRGLPLARVRATGELLASPDGPRIATLGGLNLGGLLGLVCPLQL